MTEFLKETGLTVTQVASAAKVSPSAVSQWASGATLSIGIKPAILLERRTGFSALWLSKGEGPKRVPAPGQPADHHLTVTATLDRLGELLMAANPATRDAVAQLLLRYAANPAEGKRIAEAIEMLLVQEDGNPAP